MNFWIFFKRFGKRLDSGFVPSDRRPLYSILRRNSERSSPALVNQWNEFIRQDESIGKKKSILIRRFFFHQIVFRKSKRLEFRWSSDRFTTTIKLLLRFLLLSTLYFFFYFFFIKYFPSTFFFWSGHIFLSISKNVKSIKKLETNFWSELKKEKKIDF